MCALFIDVTAPHLPTECQYPSTTLLRSLLIFSPVSLHPNLPNLHLADSILLAESQFVLTFYPIFP